MRMKHYVKLTLCEQRHYTRWALCEWSIMRSWHYANRSAPDFNTTPSFPLSHPFSFNTLASPLTHILHSQVSKKKKKKALFRLHSWSRPNTGFIQVSTRHGVETDRVLDRGQVTDQGRHNTERTVVPAVVWRLRSLTGTRRNKNQPSRKEEQSYVCMYTMSVFKPHVCNLYEQDQNTPEG